MASEPTSGRMRAAVPMLLVLSLLAAGCFGKAPPAGPVKPASTAGENDTSFALPVGGTSAAASETNVTEKGAGGVQHTHDYWKGRTSVVVFQGDVVPAVFPFFPEGQGTTPKGVSYVVLPNTSLVYEGTSKVRLVVRAPTVRGTAEPTPPALSFSYRTAADTAWRSGGEITYNTPIEIAVRPTETDMPHSVQSLWNFRLLFDRPALTEAVNVTLTAIRGGDVASWPGHPNFYPNGRTERVVFDQDVKTHVYGFPQDGFYEGTEAWVPPQKLVSYGTGWLDVYVNVTGFSSTPPIPATLYELYVHNATQLGVTCCDGDVWQDADGKNNLKTYHFHVNVTAEGMDGPYQPASRWGVHLAAVTGAFSDSTSYDIAYHMTIVAHKGADAMAGMTM